jgi:hypothetical protein
MRMDKNGYWRSVDPISQIFQATAMRPTRIQANRIQWKKKHREERVTTFSCKLNFGGSGYPVNLDDAENNAMKAEEDQWRRQKDNKFIGCLSL